METRAISVVTPEGRLPGYLLGIDPTHVVLYAQFRQPSRDEVKVVWSVIIVPRSMTMIVEDQRVSGEAKEVQEQYASIARRFLEDNRILYYGEDDE